MTNYDWLKSMDIDTFAQFLQHTLFVRNIKTGETKDIGAKTFINACVDIGKWLNEPQEFEVEHTIQNEGRMTMKTMLEDFFEKFPNALRSLDGTPDATCPSFLYGFEPIGDCDKRVCIDCWSRPVPPRRECYKNATVIVEYDKNGDPIISWVRQDNTEKISEYEALNGVKIKVKANE